MRRPEQAPRWRRSQRGEGHHSSRRSSESNTSSRGATGELLRKLLESEQIWSIAIPITEETRENLAVSEKSTGAQYRFVMPGPTLRPEEWKACLEVLVTSASSPGHVIASGSLPPGVPPDFYAKVAQWANRENIKFVIDSSGEALELAIKESVYLVKPSLRELEQLVRRELPDRHSQLRACRTLIENGRAHIVALTLGAQGALLISRESTYWADPLTVDVATTVGAGDSFLGGLIWSMSSGNKIEDSLRFAVAAGSAALLGRGTELAHAQQVQELYSRVHVTTS